jgi:transcriptional regulator with XRE-family HTH domain
MILRLKQARQMAGLTLRDAAKGLGFSFQYLNKIEKDGCKLDSSTLIKFANYYKVTVEYLLRTGPEVELTNIKFFCKSKYLFVAKKVTKKKFCKSVGCFTKAAPGRTECWKHISRRLRAAKPINAAFHTLKMNAKRRNKEFSITLQYFTELCLESGYIEGKGRGANDLTIDRDKNYLGYIPGNIKVMLKHENCSKGDRDKFHMELGIQLEGDIPF